MESKEDKFQRIKEARLPKAIKTIELLENLSGSNYACSKADAKDMIEALTNAVNQLSEAFGIVVVTPDAPAPAFQPMPLNESNARWAYDKLKAGKTKDGIELLRKAIKGD